MIQVRRLPTFGTMMKQFDLNYTPAKSIFILFFRLILNTQTTNKLDIYDLLPSDESMRRSLNNELHGDETGFFLFSLDIFLFK